MQIAAEDFDNIDSHFSPELLSLMGEWVTYRAFESKQGLADDYPLREMFDKSLLWDDTDIFGIMGHYGSAINQKHFWVASMLLQYRIVKTEAPHLKSIVSYDDVRQAFLENIGEGGESIFVNFANTLCYEFENFRGNGTRQTKIKTFTIESECKPLVDAFKAEGYLNSQEGTYFWTPKIHPFFEYSGVWGQSEFVSNEQRFIESLPSNYLRSLDMCHSEKGFFATLQMLKNHPDTQNSHFISEANKPAPHMIMRILYPEINTETADLPKLLWFGEAIPH